MLLGKLQKTWGMFPGNGLYIKHACVYKRAWAASQKHSLV